MSELVIAGRVATMEHGATEEPLPGRVWIRDGRIVAVTSGTTAARRVYAGARGRRR